MRFAVAETRSRNPRISLSNSKFEWDSNASHRGLSTLAWGVFYCHGLHKAVRLIYKAALVAAGYLLAILATCLALSIYYVATDGPDRQASSGMYSFADGLLFLAVFGLASIPASCAALYFLRQVQRFWSALAFVALSIATTGLVALYAYFVRPSAVADSVLYMMVILWPIRVLFAPLLAVAFFISGLFAPSRSSRFAIFVAAAMEALVFASVAIHFVLTNLVLAK